MMLTRDLLKTMFAYKEAIGQAADISNIIS